METTNTHFSATDMDKAREAGKAKREAALKLNLRRDFMDDEQWQELSKDLNVRLPNWTYPPEPRTMRRWLRKFHIKERVYLESAGYDRLEDFQRLNPTWPLRAWVGILLEYVDEMNQAKATLRRQPV